MAGKKKDGDGGGVDTIIRNEDKEDIKRPKKYKVILHNDDFTPMNFVALLLKLVFNMSDEKAWAITLNVHEKGRGIAGVYSKEVAETKCFKVNETANTQRSRSKLTKQQKHTDTHSNQHSNRSDQYCDCCECDPCDCNWGN